MVAAVTGCVAEIRYCNSMHWPDEVPTNCEHHWQANSVPCSKSRDQSIHILFLCLDWDDAIRLIATVIDSEIGPSTSAFLCDFQREWEINGTIDNDVTIYIYIYIYIYMYILITYNIVCVCVCVCVRTYRECLSLLDFTKRTLRAFKIKAQKKLQCTKCILRF